MLIIREEQMKTLSQLHYKKLKVQIDKIFFERFPTWDKLDKEQKNNWMQLLINESEKAKMTYDSEYILFSVICMSSTEGYQGFLKRDDVSEIISDKQLTNSGKLAMLSTITNTDIRNIQTA